MENYLMITAYIIYSSLIAFCLIMTVFMLSKPCKRIILSVFEQSKSTTLIIRATAVILFLSIGSCSTFLVFQL